MIQPKLSDSDSKLEKARNNMISSCEEDTYSDVDYKTFPDYYWEIEYESEEKTFK